MDSYAVLLSRPESPNPAAVARALSRFRKIPAQDAARDAWLSWGIVADGLDASRARELCSELEREGMGGMVLPAGSLAELPPARPAACAELSAASCRFEFRDGEPELIAWDRVSLLAALGFQQSSSAPSGMERGPGMAQKALQVGLMLATGLPIRFGGGKRAAWAPRESLELVFYLDILAGPATSRIRIDGQSFDYSCLDDRMTYDAPANFRFFVSELSRRAVSAARNHGVRVLLEGRPMREMGYRSLGDMERECRWMLTMAGIRP